MRLPILAAALLTATAAAAQTPATPAGTPSAVAATEAAMAKLLAADKNKDGKWNKAEWLAAGRREMGFNFIDADKDGFVTGDELRAGVARARAMGFAQ
ncbi:hypothetical protein IP88_11930 [alpha proteobacterium AAP81b]|nr:hypothetical protein IP88_11930 [alpha proteobacterium AAP81b]